MFEIEQAVYTGTFAAVQLYDAIAGHAADHEPVAAVLVCGALIEADPAEHAGHREHEARAVAGCRAILSACRR
jgi:hypothetical protein